jgi:hypothetical protein
MSDSLYAIDIAAAMPAGEKVVSELQAMTKALLGAGVNADALHDAVALAANSLSAASAASATANANFARGASELKSLEKAALAAAKAEQEAAKLGVVPPNVAASVVAATQAITDHKVKLDALKATAQGASAQQAELARQLNNVKQAAATGAKALGQQEASTKQLAAEQEKALKTAEELTGTGKFRKLQEAMGTTEGRALLMGRAVAVAATAFFGLSVAFAAVTVAAIAGVAAITSWAISLSNVNREAKLNAEAVAALKPEVAALSGLFGELNAETGLGDKKLLALTYKLRDAGVGAVDMAGALRDAALAERALGDGGADDFIASIKEAKGAVAGLSNEVRGKLGVIVSKQMLGLDAQSERLKKNIGGLFGDLNIEPALSGLQRLGALFDKNTEAGGALKFLFESVFQPIVDQAEAASVAVEAFALGFLIGMTKLYIAVKPTLRVLEETFGFDDDSLTSVLGDAKSAGEAIAPVVAGLAIAFTATAAAIGVVVGLMAAVGAAFFAIPAAISSASQALGNIFGNAIKAVIELVTGVPQTMTGVGANMMQGLVDGITGGAANVVKAITGAVGDAITGARKLLGIASPSRVFAEMGGYTAEGFAMGVDDGAGEAQSALAAMVAPPEPSAIEQAYATAGGGASSSTAASAPAAAAPGASASGGWSGDLILQFPNVKDAKEAIEEIREAVTMVLRGDVAQLGAGAGAT